MANPHLHPWVLGAECGQYGREVDRAHPLGLHRAELDGSAQASATASTASRAAAAAASVARASGSSACPASVSLTLWVERSNSVAPSSFSSLRTPAETADWTTCSRSDARVKLRSSATATNVASCRSSTPRRLSPGAITVSILLR